MRLFTDDRKNYLRLWVTYYLISASECKSNFLFIWIANCQWLGFLLFFDISGHWSIGETRKLARSHDTVFESLTISNCHTLLYHDVKAKLGGPRAHSPIHMIHVVIWPSHGGHFPPQKYSFWESVEHIDIEQASSTNSTLSNVSNIFELQCGHFEIWKMAEFF